MKLTLMRNMKAYYKNNLVKKMTPGFFNIYSVISPVDADRKKFDHLLQSLPDEGKFDPSILGLNTK